jgi:hypothetical protein
MKMRIIDETVRLLGPAIDAALEPLDRWAHQCHAASVHILPAIPPELKPRVARGTCSGVGGQHSWVILGGDCYDTQGLVIDPTLWSYNPDVSGVWYGRGRHRPHGAGSIWEWGRPPRADETGEEPLELTPSKPWSAEARGFLEMLGPLGLRGWIALAHAPVEGWPAGEIVDALCNTRDPRVSGEQKTNTTLGGYVPIDIIGMTTDRNPSGLYLPTAG